VVGGQAIGTFADFIGLFMGAMWRKDAIPSLRQNWPLIARSGKDHPLDHPQTRRTDRLKILMASLTPSGF